MSPRASAIGILRPVLALLPLLLAVAAGAATIERSLPLGDALAPTEPAGRWLAEVTADPAADRALLPSLTWWWALEDGEAIARAELIVRAEVPVAAMAASPTRLPLAAAEGGAARDTAGDALYAADYRLQLSPPRVLHGRVLQSLTLTPLRLGDGALRRLASAAVRLEIESAASPALVRAERPDFPLRERILRTLGDKLLNPEALPAPVIAADRAVGGAGFPTDVPSIEGAAVDMVIVTVDSFADMCQSYADHKTEFGLATVVRTVEWIETHYPFGSDRAEAIRRFLQDAYAKWSIEYAFLVGDAKEIPPRYAFSTVFADNATSATDMYYACLDGDWNADHDALWAEAADSSEGVIGDVADFVAELNVGRMPAGGIAQCQIMLDKSRTYMDAGNTPYQDRVLMLGEVLFPLDYPENPNIIIDGAAYCESIYVNYTGPEQHVVRLYENYTEYPGALSLTRQSARDSMENGFGVVLHNGHGARQTMSVGDGSLDNVTVSNLQNGDNLFLLYMVNCTAAAFDYNSLAEAFLRNPNGGTYAVIGSTGLTFANVSDNYMNVFFDEQFNDKTKRLGHLFYDSMNAFEPLTIEDNGYRWAHITYVLLGDPSQWVHYEAVEQLATDAPGSKILDGTPLGITVTRAVGGAPVEGATVTLLKSDELYQRRTTDAAGMVTMEVTGESAGVYQINLDARDFSLGNAWFVGIASGPLLSIDSMTIDDTTDGTVIGNGNGVAERGETVRLVLPIRNGGTAGVTNLGAVLRTEHPSVELIDSLETYGSIAAGATANGSDPYLFRVLEDVEDDEILGFTLALGATEGDYGDDFHVETASARLEVYRSDLDDAGGGNGDGELTVGETGDFSISLANYGRADAQGVTASLEAPAGSGITVQSGPVALGDLAALSTGLGPAAYTIERTTADAPDLEFILDDAYGRADTLRFALERPQTAVDSLLFEYLADVTRLRLNWGVPASGGVAAYVVERAEAEGGPFDEISPHWVISATFEDGALSPFTNYWYRIAPLSDAGLPGPTSTSFFVTTNPQQIPGWPVQLGQETPSSPVVCDVDFDGDYEVFIGADKLYGFHADGTELHDGDDDPNTYGPVSALGQKYFCALSAANLSSNPGVEVVASSWDTGEVFVFEFTPQGDDLVASVAPGWPRSINNPNGYGIWASPTIGDIDGDTDLEIIVTDVGGWVMGWHHDGTEITDGDDNPLTQGVFAGPLWGWSRSTGALIDVDGDEDYEVLIGTADGKLYCYDDDGSIVAGWPFTAPPFDGQQGFHSSPSVGDIDGDGFDEIVIASENDSLYALERDGSRMPGWPLHLPNNNANILAPSAALVDINDDDALDIFIAGNEGAHYMRVGWLDYTGAWLPGWPVASLHYSQASPTIVDLEGDGDWEAVLSNEDALIEAWHHDGSYVEGFPLLTGDFNRASATFLDVNQDGNLDLLQVGWDQRVYLWTFPTAYDPDNTPWYTFMHDQKRTGNAALLDWIVSVEDPGGVPGVVRLDANYPNPFNPVTHIGFSLAEDAEVELSVFDVRGRRVAELVNGKLSAGAYQRSWNGRDGDGHALASGIYFARLRVGDRVESRKMTLLK